MKRAVLYVIGAMMVLSLAACTPTTEKNKTGQVKQQNGVATEKMPDPTAPDLEVISIYTVDEEGTGIAGTMEAVEEKTAQTLVDLLIQYGTLDEGTTVISFEAEGTPADEEVGPGVVKIPGMQIESNVKELGILELNQFPSDEKKDVKLKAVVNTFLENMDVLSLTVKVNGEVLAENVGVEGLENEASQEQ